MVAVIKVLASVAIILSLVYWIKSLAEFKE